MTAIIVLSIVCGLLVCGLALAVFIIVVRHRVLQRLCKDVTDTLDIINRRKETPE
jgi:hypothetical protein